MKFLKQILASLLAIILFVVLVFVVLGGIVNSKEDSLVLEKKHILKINLNKPIADRVNQDPLAHLDPVTLQVNKPLATLDVLENIEKAKSDPNIAGIYLDLTGVAASMATVEEIRNALLNFKNSGKFIYTYSATLSQKGYYLATVSDKIFLNPEGMLEFYGLSSSVNFYTKALEKLGVEMQVIRHGKFKSAVEPFMLTEMSDASREQTEAFIGSFWEHMLFGIAKQRKISTEELQRIADGMLATQAGEAVKYGLADQVAYEDEVEALMLEHLNLESDEELPYLSLTSYKRVKTDEPLDVRNRIAVIYAEGAIETGMIPGEGAGIQAGTMVKAIRKARLNDRVKAIVLRVNSPGGSALASDIIWRELELCKGVKPLIVSMGGVAASGGYYIACNADTIVASPNTITGSIGVFGLVPNMQGLVKDKLGVYSSTIKTNEMADFGNLMRPLSPAERDFLQANVVKTYDTFIGKVAAGRGLTKEQVDALGQGRVWSGVAAKELGLVDLLGGLELAIELAAQKAGLESYSIKAYPESKDPMQELLKGLKGQISAELVGPELEEIHSQWQHLKVISQWQGIQARMPYEYTIQ